MAHDLTKPRRVQDEGYLNFVRSSRCAVVGCHAFAIDAHHTITRGAGGSDYSAIPVCRSHHSELHHIGRARFESEYGISLAAVNARLLGEYLAKIQGGFGG